MMKTLAQIVATFLSIGLTFFAAYLVYLFSSQANIDEKIQVKGYNVTSLLRETSQKSYEKVPFFPGYYLLTQYEEWNPDKTHLDILNIIANHLYFAVFGEDTHEFRTLSSFEKGDTKRPFLGRVFLWLIQDYMDHITPGKIKSDRVKIYPPVDDMLLKRQLELFPSGPLEVERWSNNVTNSMRSIKDLFSRKKIFLSDLRKFTEELDDNKSKDWYNRFDYDAWLDMVYKTLLKIEVENDHIQSLLSLKKTYSRESRLPHRGWITCLWALSFLCGVFLPLCIIGLKLENSLPSTFNISILLATFVFLIGGVFLLGKDMLSTNKKGFFLGSVLPLSKQLQDYKRGGFEHVDYEYDIVNRILDDKKKFKQDGEFVKILEEYQAAVVDSNRCSRKMAAMLIEALRQNDKLKRFKADPSSGGKGICIVQLLNPSFREKFVTKMAKAQDTLCFSAWFSRFHRDVIKVKLPRNKHELKRVISEIDLIYDELSKTPEVKGCISKREQLKKIREKLLNYVNTLIEKD